MSGLRPGVFGTSLGRRLATGYDLEVDGLGAYYVGELGVRVRGSGMVERCE